MGCSPSKILADNKKTSSDRNSIQHSTPITEILREEDVEESNNSSSVVASHPPINRTTENNLPQQNQTPRHHDLQQPSSINFTIVSQDGEITKSLLNAAAMCDLQTLENLVARDEVDLNIRDPKGRTALDIAKENGHLLAAECLEVAMQNNKPLPSPTAHTANRLNPLAGLKR